MNKLDNVTTQYRKFNENQVLTEGQLNEFIDYFEDQDRLSRTRLSGVGIACGFKSTSVYGYNPMLVKQRLNISAIAITQGAGVTTDGDLITLRQKEDKPSEVTIDFDAKNYAYYRNYIDEVGYEHFRIGDTQIPLLELITQEEYDQLQAKGVNVVDFRPVAEINNINDKIIILYLESYSNEEWRCEDADCDNTGAEQVSNLTVLLADSQSVSDLLTNGNAKDTLYKIHNTYEELFDNLPNLEAKRVILDQSITTAPQLKTRFQNAIGSVSELSEGFNAIANTFNISVNLGGQSLINKLNSLLYTTSPRLEDYQYRYDLLKDLIDTYNEIKGLILHLNVECNPNISSFPKHLMLGSVGATLELGEHTPFRHGFYNSPVTTNDDEYYERIIMLANRFVEKINGFQSYIGPIKITPSNLNVRLGEKAIPYYYNVDKALLDKWNFEKTKTDRETYNLSYHTTHLAGEDYVQNPLNYSIDNNDFYRIEGHLGLPYKTALQNINDIKTRYGLAFDVITLVLKKGETLGSPPSTEEKTISIENLRKQLVSISSDISNQVGDSQSTLQTISNLDAQLKLLNQADFSSTTLEGVTVLKQDSKKDDVVSELLSEFLERKSGLEHVAGVEPGGTFVLVYESETNNQVLADFSLPYLCCSKEIPNIPPIAQDDSVSCLQGQTVIISVLANDNDPDNNPLTVMKKSDPSYGTIVLNSDGTISYTHDNSVNIEDSFTYCINDGKEDSNIATVYIDIKIPPVAIDDTLNVERGFSITKDLRGNDSDINSKALSVIIKAFPAHGQVKINNDGTITYTHNGLTSDRDLFTYSVTNGDCESNVARVTVNVSETAPVAVDDNAFVKSGNSVTINVKDNDSDTYNRPLSVHIVTNPSHGTVTVNSNGTITYQNDATENTTDSFTYKLYNGISYSNTATVNITVGDVFVFDADYAVLTYEFTDGQDLDTRTRIVTPDIGMDNYLGFSKGKCFPVTSDWSETNIPTNAVLDWAGDNQRTGFESILIDINKLKQLRPLITDLAVDLRCGWWSTRGNNPVNVKAIFYKGGQMIKENYQYNNPTAISSLEVTNNSKQISYMFNEDSKKIGARLGVFKYNTHTHVGYFDMNDINTQTAESQWP